MSSADPRQVRTPSELSDRLAIQDLLTTYARAVDTKDWDLYESVFSPDALIDYTSSGGIRGSRAEVRAWVAKALELFTMTQHLVTNHHIVVNGDTATSHTDFFNPMGRPDGKGGLALFFVGGTYRDELKREDGGWVITERIEEMLWFAGDWPQRTRPA
jgi:3-phenylpropionate/cinnamic acid dioxygenase small subunit